MPESDVELLARRRDRRGLGEAAVAERERLIGAEHQHAGTAARDRECFLAGKQLRDFLGRGAGMRRLHYALIDIGRIDLDRNAGRFQERAAHLALRGEHERRTAPQVHGPTAATRRRSCRSEATAAAVSSIERRVTSIDGQP